jgi:hypothetical protein
MIPSRDHTGLPIHFHSSMITRSASRMPFADAGERFATPVCEFCDQLVNSLRWIHLSSLPRILISDLSLEDQPRHRHTIRQNSAMLLKAPPYQRASWVI